MDDAKQQLADKLKSANNILVTVSRNPSVDQLSALLGLTLLLNKSSKHAVAVFSGQVPSTIEFLKPEETIEKNTDSLRDFIIALDKNKADKLRYKVENDVVRIFITPYKTSIGEKDFEFSQGDFNVDVVVALGVQRQEDLDEAITSHGRILHDATVANIDIAAGGDVGTINWHVPQASSLSELVTELAQAIDAKLLDEQIATALLTGIVSATNRFSNERTSSQTMTMSAILMAAGANQQLVTSKLAEMANPPSNSLPVQGVDMVESSVPDDGAIEINHEEIDDNDTPPDAPLTDTTDQPGPGPGSSGQSDNQQSDNSKISPEGDNATPINAPLNVNPPSSTSKLSPGSRMITEPPSMGGTLTANSSTAGLDPVTDPMSMPSSEPPQILQHQNFDPPADAAPAGDPLTLPTDVAPVPATPTPPSSAVTTPAPESAAPSSGGLTPPNDNTLTQIEKAVDSPHLDSAKLDTSGLDSARSEVSQALNSGGATNTSLPEPIEALNAQELSGDLHPSTTSGQVIITQDGSLLPAPPAEQAPAVIDEDRPSGAPPAPIHDDPLAPPPVPPPIPFQFGSPPAQA